jgi:hypothetical protein
MADAIDRVAEVKAKTDGLLKKTIAKSMGNTWVVDSTNAANTGRDVVLGMVDRLQSDISNGVSDGFSEQTAQTSQLLADEKSDRSKADRWVMHSGNLKLIPTFLVHIIQIINAVGLHLHSRCMHPRV